VTSAVDLSGLEMLKDRQHETIGLPFAIRAMEPGDRNYVLDSWLKSRLQQLRKKYPKRRMSIANRHAWFAESRPRFRAVLEDDSTVALVACDPLRPDRILGWLVDHPGKADGVTHVKGWCGPFRDLIVGALRERAGLEAA
jgi:hypothetical protein